MNHKQKIVLWFGVFVFVVFGFIVYEHWQNIADAQKEYTYAYAYFGSKDEGPNQTKIVHKWGAECSAMISQHPIEEIITFKNREGVMRAGYSLCPVCNP